MTEDMLDTGMNLRSGSTSKQPDKGPTMEGDGTYCPTIEYDTLVVAFIEALSDPSVVAKLNKAIDYDRISTAVSNQVEILINPSCCWRQYTQGLYKWWLMQGTFYCCLSCHRTQMRQKNQ